MKNITVTEVFSPGCHVCRMFEEYWESIKNDWPNVALNRLDVTTPEGQEAIGKYQIFASPGIIINDELWATGGFDKKKLVDTLKKLSE